MERTERTVSELASLFRMLQVIPDADSVGKVYQILLAFCTTWRTIGFERAFLLRVDDREGIVRGHLAAEQQLVPEDVGSAHRSNESFEALAKNVFDNYERIDSSDLTLRARTFAVPLDWNRSAVVKAVNTGYPVLAERKLSEFATDPFFDFFGSSRYIAVPVKIGAGVRAVLTADNGQTDENIHIEDVSLVYSLAQQAALAVERLMESGDNKRKFRILRKLQDILSNAATPEALGEGLTLALSIVSRAVGGSGAFLKDMVRQKTLHVKSVDEYSIDAGESDISIGESFEEILDRTAGSMKPTGGDHTHPLLGEVASEAVSFFHATPLAFLGEGLGALAVYVERTEGKRRGTRMEAGNRVFLDLCAGMIAERLSIMHKARLVDRADSLLDEVQSNLVRERETSRVGARAIEYYETLAEDVAALKDVAFSGLPYEKRVEKMKEMVSALEEGAARYRSEVGSIQSSLRMIDLFSVVDDVVREWRPRVEAMDVAVDVRIPQAGPSLLMNRASIERAMRNILSALTSCVREKDRVMVECKTTGEKAIVCIADTGDGLPGNLLSRLFMPFSEVETDDEFTSAMSLAGDIVHRHAGEIMVKSSPSWKTILILSFPVAANRDRRRTRVDRRHRRGDRREPTTSR